MTIILFLIGSGICLSLLYLSHQVSLRRAAEEQSFKATAQTHERLKNL